MPKYHLDNCCVKGRPRNWGLEIWSSQVGWGEYVCVCVCVCVCGGGGLSPGNFGYLYGMED